MPPIGGWKTGAYAIRNLVNGKVYVGSAAKSLARRFTSHRYLLRSGRHPNRHLQSSWNKYGEEAFLFEVLGYCSPNKCLDVEQGWIDRLQTCNVSFGYNKSPVAGSPLGVRHSKEVRDKVSRALVGKKKSPQHSANISTGKKGRPNQKLSAYSRRRTVAHQLRLKISAGSRVNPIRGPMSEETKRKIADKARERHAKRKQHNAEDT